MSTALNQSICLQAGGNTGVGNCFINPKETIGAIILPPGTSFSGSSIATPSAFLAALITATMAPKKQRAYPMHDFQELKDGSESLTEQSFGYGGKAPVREGFFIWEFQYVKGGLCLSKSMRKFNNSNVDVLFVDAEGLVWGLKVGDTLQGINQSYIYSNPPKWNDGSKATAYTQKFVFKPQFLDSFGYIQLGAADFDQVQGLQNVVISSGGARVTNVSLLKANLSCGAESGADVFDLYSTELAAAANWIAKDAITNNVVAITSVAANNTIGGWTGTLDTGDANYNATHAVIWTFAAPTVLAGNSILGIESNTFQTPN